MCKFRQTGLQNHAYPFGKPGKSGATFQPRISRISRMFPDPDYPCNPCHPWFLRFPPKNLDEGKKCANFAKRA